MPKRDPNDGGKKTKIGFIFTSTGLGAKVVLDLTNPNPSKDAIEGHADKMKSQPVEEEHGLWEAIKSLF